MISAAVIAAGMLASCSNKEIVDEQPETDGVSASVLNIVPTVGTDTRAGFVPKTEWAVNDAMGLFMYKATGWGDAYPRYDAQNNKSTKTAAGWSQAKQCHKFCVSQATITRTIKKLRIEYELCRKYSDKLPENLKF